MKKECFALEFGSTCTVKVIIRGQIVFLLLLKIYKRKLEKLHKMLDITESYGMSSLRFRYLYSIGDQMSGCNSVITEIQ